MFPWLITAYDELKYCFGSLLSDDDVVTEIQSV